MLSEKLAAELELMSGELAPPPTHTHFGAFWGAQNAVILHRKQSAYNFVRPTAVPEVLSSPLRDPREAVHFCFSVPLETVEQPPYASKALADCANMFTFCIQKVCARSAALSRR